MRDRKKRKDNSFNPRHWNRWPAKSHQNFQDFRRLRFDYRWLMPKESKSSLSLSLFNIYAGKVHASTGMCESGTPSSGSLVRKHTTSFTESSMTCSLHILEVYTTCFFDHATEAGREGGSYLNAYIETSRGVLAPPAGGAKLSGKRPPAGAQSNTIRIRHKKIDKVQRSHVAGGHCRTEIYP